MRYQVLATDYDGTLAHHGTVDEKTIQSLEKLLASGRRLILVTGRELPHLQAIFSRTDLFEWIVAENGALLYHPPTKEEVLLAEPPPDPFIAALKQRSDLSVSYGRVIVATWEPHERFVLETIRSLGLELQVIFNKGAVMVLPAGVNKASGLAAALARMGVSPHNVVAVGDAENDHALLRSCEFSVAVENALPAVKESADWVAPYDHGRGVAELIHHLVDNDLADLSATVGHYPLAFGEDESGPASLPPYGQGVLITGPSASGKSTVATRIVEMLSEADYQFCLIDPEGDYENLEGAIVLGGPKAAPRIEEVLQVLENPAASVVVSMTGMAIPDRPPFFLNLLPQLLHLRALVGRPHWLILDEAHHLLPADWKPPQGLLPESMNNTVLITVHPKLLARDVLARLNLLIAVGAEFEENLTSFAEATKQRPPKVPPTEPVKGTALVWNRTDSNPPRIVTLLPCQQERRRHRRKYAEGELVPERSFYFRGPEGKLNLRAQNLMLFLQLADGVDDATWEFHRQRGDYSGWLRNGIKDNDLADEVARLESLSQLDPMQGRAQIRAVIERSYTIPADPPLPVPGAE